MQALVQMIEGGALNSWVNSASWIWIVLEIIHFFGLSLLLGGLIVIDLRLAGFFRGINIVATHKLLPWVFIGFGLNMASGVLFFFGDPARYSANIGFRIKMILVVVAGLNALLYYWKLDSPIKTWDPHGDTPALAKTVAFVSLGAWTGVLLLGRLIPYIGTG